MNSPHDPLLEEHLRGGSELSRRYRDLPTDEVPPELDSRVLAHARREIERAERVRAWRKWTPPFALAASVLLAFSILLRSAVEREGSEAARAPLVASNAKPAAPNQTSKNEGQIVSQVPAAPTDAANVSQPAPVLSTQLSDRSAATASVSSNGERTLDEPIRQMLQLQAPKVHMESRSPAPAAPDMAFQVDSEQSQSPVEKEPQLAAESSLGAVQADELKKAAQNIDADKVAERWLSEIRKLRSTGKTAVADREWRKFRNMFPSYEVAADDAARPAPH